MILSYCTDVKRDCQLLEDTWMKLIETSEIIVTSTDKVESYSFFFDEWMKKFTDYSQSEISSQNGQNYYISIELM